MSESKTSKSGRPRKSRRRRLAWTWDQPAPSFSPTEAQWSAIEREYGVILAERQRARLREIVDGYFRHEVIERTAPFLDDALLYLDGCERMVSPLHQWVRNDPYPDKEHAAFYSRIKLQQNASAIPEAQYGDRFDYIGRCMSVILDALDTTREQLQAERGFEEGQTWAWLIGLLHDFALLEGFPHTASKGQDKSRDRIPSPFVRFVWELQRLFPQESQRHMASSVALAQGITVGRRRYQRERKVKE